MHKSERETAQLEKLRALKIEKLKARDRRRAECEKRREERGEARIAKEQTKKLVNLSRKIEIWYRHIDKLKQKKHSETQLCHIKTKIKQLEEEFNYELSKY